MKSPSRTICYLTYKLRCFLSVFFLTVCALSFSTYSASDGDAPGTTSSPKNTTTHLPSNSTTAIIPTTSVSRTNPCSQITSNQAAQSCNTFFNNPTAAGASSFEKAVVVSNAQGLISEVKNASPKGTIIVVNPGSYDLTELLKPNQRIALIGVKTGETRPTIRMTSALLKKEPEADTLVYLTRPNRGASAGFYSAFINWETNIDDSDYDEDEDYAYTVYGNNYPGEIRLYDNTFIHSDKNDLLDEYISLINPKGKVVIDSNKFNTSNLYYSAVYSECNGCGENEHEIIITNNSLTSTDGADNDSENAFHLVDHKKFTIKNNTSLNSQANASMEIELPNEPGLQSTIENNTADTGAAIEHRSIEIELKKNAMDNYKIAGRLTVSGNDYFDVDHEDEDGDYLVLTEGRKIPASSSSVRVSLSLTPTSVMVSPSVTTTPAAAKNPCNSLNHDATARKICNDFLNSPQASGNDKAFSHAFVVRNIQELFNAVERDHLDGTAFTGSIIVLRAGTYEIPRQLRINHKVALVGEKSGDSLPEIKAGKDILKIFHDLNSLVHLKRSSSQPTSGFYSTHIQWDTSIDTDIRGVVCEGAIGSTSYPGKIRIFENHFKHQGTKTDVYDFLKLKDSYGDTYIGHNTFDTTYLKSATVDAYCVSCLDFDPKLEIVSNSLVSQQDSKRNTVSSAFEVKGYKRFWIENNQQKNSKAAAYIKVRLKNNTSGLRGFIRNNVALQTAPADQREIKVWTFHKHGMPLNINGSLITTPNRHYTVIDPENLIAHIGSTVGAPVTSQASSTAQTAVSPSQVTPTSAALSPAQTQQAIASDSIKPSPTQAIPATSSITPTSASKAICDHIQSSTEFGSSEIDACKAFLENEKTSAGHTFSMAVVVSNAKELDDAVIGKFPSGSAKTSKLIVLKSGTYHLTQSLNISHKIALVGTVQDGEYPVIRIADDFSTPSQNNRALAYLYDDATVAETGFYSHHIHWNTTPPPYKSMLLFMGAINSQSYQGELRFYENKFSQTTFDQIISYIQLINAVGGAYVENNRFDTAYLNPYTSAIIAHCSSAACEAAEPHIEIRNNRFHSKHIAYRINRPLSITVRGYMRYKIIGNQQETKDAAGRIYIKDHSNIKHIDGYVLNNIAHEQAPQLQRIIFVESFFSPEQSLFITGKLHVAGNDYYDFTESGLALKYVDYKPGIQLSSSQIASPTPSTVRPASSAYSTPDFSEGIVTSGLVTPSQLLLSVSTTASISVPTKKHICDDVKDDATAFAACDAFLKNEKASGPASNKPTFTHVFLVDSTQSLLEKAGLKEYNGKPVSGSIILLKPGTYEVPHPIQIKQRIALVGVKSADGTYPIIQVANDYKVISEPRYYLVHLHAGTISDNTGFYSFNLTWKLNSPSDHNYLLYESLIYGDGYNGEVRLFNNHFKHDDQNAWARHSILLNNAKMNYYIGSNTFDTSNLVDSVIESSGSYDRGSKAAIDIESNTFTNSLESVRPEIEAIVLSRYQYLSVLDNVQQTPKTAGSIEITFDNNVDIKKASVHNNTAHQEAIKNHRTIWLKLNKRPEDSAMVSGIIDVTGNEFYAFEIADLPAENYRYSTSKKVASIFSSSLTMPPLPVTPSVSYRTSEVSATTPSQPVKATAPINSYGTPQLSPTRKIRSASSSSAPTQLTQPLPESTQSSIRTTPLSVAASSTQPVKSSVSSTRPRRTVTSSASSTPPLLNSPCDQLPGRSQQAWNCQEFLDELKDLEIRTTFSEAVMVKTSQELINEITTTSESGKVILLLEGSYALDEPLHILKTVALVSIGNAVVKPSGDYPAKAGALVLLDDAGTGHGFFTKGMTWDISAFEDSQTDPLSTAVKAVNYEGKLLMSGNDFQYHANREDEETPSHYIKVQNSSGDVLIAGNTFFSGGLQKAAIYASCQGCETADQTINISGNHFTDSNDGKSALTAIDIRYYKKLDVHDNVQDTESASAGINIELPNHTDDINAIIKDNVAIGTSDETRRTIDLTVARLAKEPANIDGTVEASNNRCFFVKHNGIPSHVLELIQGSCPITSSSVPTAQAHIGEQSSSGISAGEGVGYTVAAVLGTYTILLISSGAYGKSPLPGHELVYNNIFLKLAWPILWLCSKLPVLKGYKPQNNEDGNELKLLDIGTGNKVYTGGKTDGRTPLTSSNL